MQAQDKPKLTPHLSRRRLDIRPREHDEEAPDQEGDGREDGVLHHQPPGQPADQRGEGAAEPEGHRVGAQPRARRAAVEPPRHELAPGVDDRRHEPDCQEVEVQGAGVAHQGHEEEVRREQEERHGDGDLSPRPLVELGRDHVSEPRAYPPREKDGADLCMHAEDNQGEGVVKGGYGVGKISGLIGGFIGLVVGRGGVSDS